MSDMTKGLLEVISVVIFLQQLSMLVLCQEEGESTDTKEEQLSDILLHHQGCLVIPKRGCVLFFNFAKSYRDARSTKLFCTVVSARTTVLFHRLRPSFSSSSWSLSSHTFRLVEQIKYLLFTANCETRNALHLIFIEVMNTNLYQFMTLTPDRVAVSRLSRRLAVSFV